MQVRKRIQLSIMLLVLLTSILGPAQSTYAQEIPTDTDRPQAPAAPAIQHEVFLPLVSNNGLDAEATPTPTPTGTPRPPLELTPGPVTEPRPDPDREDVQYPENGICPAGTHLVHSSGILGLFAADSEEIIDDIDYTCEPDQAADAAACGAQGTPVVIGGVAACSCAEGYAGAACQLCAPGYAPSGGGQCKLMPTQPEVVVAGIEDSLEVGQSRTLRATDAEGNPVVATWTLVETTPGQVQAAEAAGATRACLYAPGSEGACETSLRGIEVGIRAPNLLADGNYVATYQLNIEPQGGLNFTTESVVIVGQGGIPISGQGDPRLEPMLDALSGFMRQRCIGAAMLGVARYGFPLATYGLGRMDGRGGDDWPDYCGDDEGQQLAEPMQQDTPMRIGSANKAVTFAVLRWVLGERLKYQDPDVSMTSVTPERAVTAARVDSQTLRLATWVIGSSGEILPLQSAEHEVDGLRDMKIITLASSRVVVAMRTLENHLRLSSWDIGDGGQLIHRSDFTFVGPDLKIIDLDLTPVAAFNVETNRFAVATRAADGDLMVRVIDVAGDGSFSMPASYLVLGDRARSIAIVDASQTLQQRIVVATRAGNNALRLRSLTIAPDGILGVGGETTEGPVHDFALASMESSRIVAAVRTWPGNLKLIVFDVENNGDFTRRGEDEAGGILDLDVTALSTRSVAAAVRQNDNRLKTVVWTVSEQGDLTRAADDLAGNVKGLDIERLAPGRMLVTVRTQEDRLKNIVLEMTNATTLARQGDAEGADVVDYAWSQSDIEELQLLGYDFPERLLPDSLHDVFSGVEDLPVEPVPDSIDFGKLGAGQSLCSTLTNKADFQWRLVRIRHLLSHSTGMQRGAPGLSYQLDRLPELRGLESQSDFIAAEAQLRGVYGDIAVDAGKSQLSYGGSPTIYAIPAPTMRETLTMVAARCLRHELGTSSYSNTSPVLSAAIVDHVATNYAARVGYPQEHAGSALKIFFSQVLGIDTTDRSGIFSSQRALMPGYVMPEPASRGWDWQQATYYPIRWDAKRPHCVWSGGECSFDDWTSSEAPHGRINWQWSVAQLPLLLTSSDNAYGSSGGLAVEPGVFLSFMRNFWVGGADIESPTYGAPRNNTWTPSRQHNGSAFGAYAFATQYASDSSRYFRVPHAPDGYVGEEDPTFSFEAMTPVYFAAHPSAGYIRSFDKLGQPTVTHDVDIAAGDAFAIGHSKAIADAANVFFIANASNGEVTMVDPRTGGGEIFQAGYQSGDGFVVDNFIGEDVYDEAAVADVVTGIVEIYRSGLGGMVASVNVNYGPGDRLAAGDYDRDGNSDLFVARAGSGDIDVYDIDGTLKLTVDANVTAGDTFTVGDVVGSALAADLLVARGGTGIVEIYVYSSGEFSLYESFASAYLSGGNLAVGDFGQGASLNQILVTVNGDVLRWQALKNEEGAYQVHFIGFTPDAYAADVQLAGGYGAGQRPYACATTDGILQGMPDGLDIIVSVNQGGDKQCTEAGGFNEDGEPISRCGDYYQTLAAVLKYGACQVDWSEVVETPPAQ